jgi:hypothetical protein
MPLHPWAARCSSPPDPPDVLQLAQLLGILRRKVAASEKSSDVVELPYVPSNGLPASVTPSYDHALGTVVRDGLPAAMVDRAVAEHLVVLRLVLARRVTFR